VENIVRLPKERAEATSQVGKPKRKNQKGKTQSSPEDLKDSASRITHQDKVPEIVNRPSDQKDSTQNDLNTPALQLDRSPPQPPAHVDVAEEPLPQTSLRRQEKLRWYGTWEDD
jgi:hypothetical protein